jgi:hypothetical protein
MTDENLEQQLRNLPARELPESWRAEILATACRAARTDAKSCNIWPEALLYLRALFVRNPITTGAMAMLWVLIFAFKASTPADPDASRYLAQIDPAHPPHLFQLSDEVRLALLDPDDSSPISRQP